MMKESMTSSAESQSLQHMTDYERRLLKSPYAKANKYHSSNESTAHPIVSTGSVQSSVQMMPKGPKQREKERLLSNAVRHLPQEKKVDLLHSLSKLEDELRSPSVMGPGSSSVKSLYSYSGQRYNNYGNDMDENGSMYDDSSISIVSMSSFGFIDKKYGVVTESPLKIMQRNVVRCLCKVGKAIESSELRHVLGGRAMTEIVGLTALREFLHSRLQCSLTTKEAELLMKFIDTGNRGEVNIYDILGMAQLNYDKLKRQTKKKRDKGLLEIERKELLVKRKDFRAKCEEESLKQGDLLPKILTTVQEASYKLLTSKNGIDLLQTCRRLIMNSTLFQEALLEFGIEITLRERKILEQRYSSLTPPRTGSVDYPSFKAEFISLGADLLMQRQKHDSVERFVKTMASVGAMTSTGNLMSGKYANALLPSSPTSHNGTGLDDTTTEKSYEIIDNPFRENEENENNETTRTRSRKGGSPQRTSSSPNSSPFPSPTPGVAASMKLDSVQSRSSQSAVTLSDVFQSANMGHPTAITAYGSVKKSQPKRRLPKGGKLEALHQTPAPSSSSSASSQDKNKDKNKNHNNDGNKSINMGNSSTISNTNTNTKTHTNTNVKTTQNTGNVVAAAVVVVPEVVEIVHEEEFPGHPDIAPGVTVDRNQSIRRRTLELTSGTGNDSTNGGISAMTNANNESLRAALDMLLDPDNDLPLDELVAIQASNSNSSIHQHSSKDSSGRSSKKKASISGTGGGGSSSGGGGSSSGAGIGIDIGGIGGGNGRKRQPGSQSQSDADNDSGSENGLLDEGLGATRDEGKDVLGPLMVEVLHTDRSQRKSFCDPTATSSSPAPSPLNSNSKVGSRRGSNSLAKTSPLTSPVVRTSKHGGASSTSPAFGNGRRNSQRRVSELIREARQPGLGFNTSTPTTSTNMAINLTEPHAFTSSIAILAMINNSSELMLDALSKDKANTNPTGKPPNTIGISSDFHRKLSVMSSTNTSKQHSFVSSQPLSSQSSSSRSSFEPSESKEVSGKKEDEQGMDSAREQLLGGLGLGAQGLEGQGLDEKQLEPGLVQEDEEEEDSDEEDNQPPPAASSAAAPVVAVPAVVSSSSSLDRMNEGVDSITDVGVGVGEGEEAIEDLVGNNSRNPALATAAAAVLDDDGVMTATVTHYYNDTDGTMMTASSSSKLQIDNNDNNNNNNLSTSNDLVGEGMRDENNVGASGGASPSPGNARPPKGRPPPKQPAQPPQAS